MLQRVHRSLLLSLSLPAFWGHSSSHQKARVGAFNNNSYIIWVFDWRIKTKKLNLCFVRFGWSASNSFLHCAKSDFMLDNYCYHFFKSFKARPKLSWERVIKKGRLEVLLKCTKFVEVTNLRNRLLIRQVLPVEQRAMSSCSDQWCKEGTA